MNVIFLDYDGVVNTPQWKNVNGRWHCSFNFPSNNKVNDEQAVQWLSEFCEKYDYSIVVTSTWRFDSNYKDCLINAGLRDGIKIIGKTPRISIGNRGDEILEWLIHRKDIESFIILDDETDMGDLMDHLVKCDTSHGFKETEFRQAELLHLKFSKN